MLVAHRPPGMVAIHFQEWMGIGGHTFHQLELQIVIALSAYLRVRGWLNQTQRSARQNIACDTSPLLNTMNVCPEGPD